jgi:hypothetical protein
MSNLEIPEDSIIVTVTNPAMLSSEIRRLMISERRTIGSYITITVTMSTISQKKLRKQSKENNGNLW